jgi:acetyl-CoA synthetase (ADP-forming)
VDACLSALKSFIDYGRFYANRGRDLPERTLDAKIRLSARRILEANKGTKLLPDDASMLLLNEYGFKSPVFRIASSLKDAENAVREVGYPVILKGVIPDIAHKSVEGLVSPPVTTLSELGKEFDKIENQMVVLAGTRNTHRVLIQKYVPHEYEIMLGVKYDPTFGPAVLFGMGGIFTEVLRDFSIRLAPITLIEAAQMLSEIKAFPILRKFRQGAELAPDLIADSIVKASQLALELNGHVSAIDINPLVLSSTNDAMIVLDAKIHL